MQQWIFISTMMLFGYNLSNISLLDRVSMNNQECKVKSEIVNVNGDDPVFFLLVLKQTNAVVVAIISMTLISNCVFLMLSKI